MLMFVPFAFLGAKLARRCAGLEQHPDHLIVLACPAHRDSTHGFADVGAVEAGADALAHVHLFGRAGVGAGRAQGRAEHGVASRNRQRLIGIAADIG